MSLTFTVTCFGSKMMTGNGSESFSTRPFYATWSSVTGYQLEFACYILCLAGLMWAMSILSFFCTERHVLCLSAQWGLHNCNMPDSFVHSGAIWMVFLLSFLLFPYLFNSLRIGLFYFQAGSRKRRPHLALVFLCLFCVIVYFVMDACLLLCVRFSFSVLSQEIGWKECIQNDLFCVRWDAKP